MEHPCYGLVPAILTLDAIKEGEELTVHYQMDMEVIYLGNQNHFFFTFRMRQIGTFSAGRRRAQRSRVIERKFIVQTFISRNIDRSLLKSSYGRTP